MGRERCASRAVDRAVGDPGEEQHERAHDAVGSEEPVAPERACREVAIYVVRGEHDDVQEIEDTDGDTQEADASQVRAMRLGRGLCVLVPPSEQRGRKS